MQQFVQIATEATEQTTTIGEALINTALGMGTTFAVLILISFLIYLLKYVPKLLELGKKKQTEEVLVSTPSASHTPNVTTSVTKDTQLVAVIAAAIAAQMTEETGVPVSAEGLVIRSIKKRTFSI